MNIKIKSSGVSCLIPDDYGRVFNTLKKQFGDSDDMIFSERTAGHDYLQWELPGDGWQSLSDSDPLMSQEVKKELIRRQKSVGAKFGGNQQMAQRVLTVPDDSYIYYKPSASGQLLILLTAWGYRYPERVNSGPAIGSINPHKSTKSVSILLEYDGKPVRNKEIRLNGFSRTTDDKGRYDLGELPIGYQFDVDIDKQHHQITVADGMDVLKFDLTAFASVAVDVALDDKPMASESVTLSYGARHLQLMTDDQGRATVKIPLSLNEEYCKVVVRSELQQKILNEGTTGFVFKLISPPSVEDTLPPQDADVESLSPKADDAQPEGDIALPEEDPMEEGQDAPDVTAEPEEDPVEEGQDAPEPEETPEDDKPGTKGHGLKTALFVLALALLTGLSYYIGLRQFL